MTLADLLGRGVQVEWHEAVALVRDVIERSARTAPGSVHELHQVELLPNGQVDLHGGAVVDRPVDWFFQMLETLISPAKPPVQFSELMANAPESVQAFSESLAYFERPHRGAILQDLYSRASGSSPLPDADKLIASLRATVGPPAAGNVEQEAQSPSHRRRVLYAAGILALVGVSIVVLALVKRGDAASSIAAASSTLTAKVSEGVTGVSDAVGNAVLSIGERAGLGTGTAPPAVETEQPTDHNAPASPSTRGRGSARPQSSALQRQPLENFHIPTLRKDQVSQAEIVDASLPAVVSERVIKASDPADAIVYSSSSQEVSAPVGLRPHFPKVLPAGLRAEDIARIELVIRPDGSVESVKLVGPPRNVHDFMLLSAAKAWRFRPAMKNGTPVPYRTTISVAR